MSDFEPVTYSEFVWLLTRTQKHHINNGEPIPAINKHGRDTIEYCLQAPFMGFGDVEFHETFDEKAAILFYDICKLHGLLNGNKRMAVETTALFAFKNSRYCFLDKKVLIDMAKKTVMSDADNKDEMVWWISRVFYGGIRKTTRWMEFKILLKFFPRLLWYIISIYTKKIFQVKEL